MFYIFTESIIVFLYHFLIRTNTLVTKERGSYSDRNLTSKIATTSAGYCYRDTTAVFRVLTTFACICPPLVFVIVVALLWAKKNRNWCVVFQLISINYHILTRGKILFCWKISQEWKISQFCFSYVFLLMICYFEPNFVEIRVQESVFFFFNFRGIAQTRRRKIR